MPTTEDFSPDGDDPVALQDVREEINYWGKAPRLHPEWFQDPGFAVKVAARLARLKRLETRYRKEGKPPLDALLEWANGHRFLTGLILALIILLLLGASFGGLENLWHSIKAAAHTHSVGIP
jgi:hypothetical protein